MFHFCRTAQPLTPALPWVVASLLITAHEHLEPPWVLSGWEQALKRTDFTPKRYQCSHLMPGAESGTAGTTLEMPAMPSCDGQAGKSRHCKASNSPGKGPSSPDQEVRPPPPRSTRAPQGRDAQAPLQHVEDLEVSAETKASSCGSPPPLHPPLARSLSRRSPGSLPGSLVEPPSWRPRGPGSPRLFRSEARWDSDTYRTPRRGRARPTQTSTAGTLLCSSDGP